MAESIQLQKVINFRDVGKTINEHLGQRRIREGVFYRSARPDDATAQDRTLIRDELGVKTIIDLRTKTEHVKQAKKRQAEFAALAPLKSNAEMAKPMHISGIDYHEIKITGRPLELFLLRQLSWWSLLNFLFLFILGYRWKAISIMSREVMLPRGLVGLGLDTLDQSQDEVRQALLLYTTPQAMPSIVHCTQGKDRTELVCALVLMILGAPVTAIEYDYFLSDDGLVSEREERVAEIREIGLTEDWANTAKGMITGMVEHLDEKYGGLDGYLDQVGFGDVERTRVREALLY